MAERTLHTIIQIRRDTATNWTTNNPVLKAGEMGFETDSLKFKFGNGTAKWSELSYASASSVKTGTTAPDDDTAGDLGAVYVNTTDNTVYQNTGATTGKWKKVVFAGDKVEAATKADSATTASTATKLATARTIALAGDATGSTTFDGSADASITVTLKDSGVTAGTGTKVTVDAKGLVTKVEALTAADLPTVGTADTYVKVTTDAYGRITAGEKAITTGEVTGLDAKIAEIEGNVTTNKTATETNAANITKANAEIAKKAVKLETATAGNVATVTADGNYADSGKAIETTVTADSANLITSGAVDTYVKNKINEVKTEGVSFKGTVADETALPTTGVNGDLYWITKFSNAAEPADLRGLSGSAIYVAKDAKWAFQKDNVSNPDGETTQLNASGQIQVKIKDGETVLKSGTDGLFTDVSALQGKIGAGTAGQVVTYTGTAGTVGALDVDSTATADSTNLITSGAVATGLAGKVNTTTTVNGKALSSNVTLTTKDVAEDTNLYYTEARATANFGTNIAATEVTSLKDGDKVLVDTDVLILDGGTATGYTA